MEVIEKEPSLMKSMGKTHWKYSLKVNRSDTLVLEIMEENENDKMDLYHMEVNEKDMLNLRAAWELWLDYTYIYWKLTAAFRAAYQSWKKTKDHLTSSLKEESKMFSSRFD